MDYVGAGLLWFGAGGGLVTWIIGAGPGRRGRGRADAEWHERERKRARRGAFSERGALDPAARGLLLAVQAGCDHLAPRGPRVSRDPAAGSPAAAVGH